MEASRRWFSGELSGVCAEMETVVRVLEKRCMHDAQQTWLLWPLRLLRRALHAWRRPRKGSELWLSAKMLFVARRKHLFLDWTFGQWTLPFEFLHIPRCDIFIDWTFGQWTLLLEFLHIPRCSLFMDWTFGQWTLLFEFSPYSSVQSIYILDIWTMDITIWVFSIFLGVIYL